MANQQLLDCTLAENDHLLADLDRAIKERDEARAIASVWRKIALKAYRGQPEENRAGMMGARWLPFPDPEWMDTDPNGPPWDDYTPRERGAC